jgi:hypothetical protein
MITIHCYNNSFFLLNDENVFSFEDKIHLMKLIEFYNNEKQKKDSVKFEIIFVSWDRDEANFKEYFGTMPWLALPYDPDKKHKVSSA